MVDIALYEQNNCRSRPAQALWLNVVFNQGKNAAAPPVSRSETHVLYIELPLLEELNHPANISFSDGRVRIEFPLLEV